MKINRSRITLMVIAALIIAMACTITASSAGIDITTGNEYIEQSNIVFHSNSAPVEDSDQKILWDLTHGVYEDYQPSGHYSDLVTILNGMGYTVQTTDIGLNNVDLSEYDILVICVASSHDTQYSPADVAAIEEFVANGGGLLIMGDNTDTPNENIQPVADLFGTQLGESYIRPSDLNITNTASHPIYDGVSRFIFRAAGEISGSIPSEEVAWDDNGNAVMTVVSCPGKVVITGDSNFCENYYIDLEDNEQLTRNIFTWLGEPCEDQSIPDENQSIPEFPTIALPMAAIIGLAFFLQRRKEK
ncbi:DUF4350 domain-containing protein [Methanolobus sp. WCC5]|uniref:DUF4350 domain-containing protein n=1 Tax=Methanolobus sp. WCC5 TaxID=3125785 RepID=UPI003244614B